MLNLIHGDCLEVMKTIPEASIDAIITDPPYNIAKLFFFAILLLFKTKVTG